MLLCYYYYDEMNLHNLFIYRISYAPIFTLIESIRSFGYHVHVYVYVYVWDIMIDSLGMSGDPPYEELVIRPFSWGRAS